MIENYKSRSRIRQIIKSACNMKNARFNFAFCSCRANTPFRGNHIYSHCRKEGEHNELLRLKMCLSHLTLLPEDSSEEAQNAFFAEHADCKPRRINSRSAREFFQGIAPTKHRGFPIAASNLSEIGSDSEEDEDEDSEDEEEEEVMSEANEAPKEMSVQLLEGDDETWLEELFGQPHAPTAIEEELREAVRAITVPEEEQRQEQHVFSGGYVNSKTKDLLAREKSKTTELRALVEKQKQKRQCLEAEIVRREQQVERREQQVEEERRKMAERELVARRTEDVLNELSQKLTKEQDEFKRKMSSFLEEQKTKSLEYEEKDKKLSDKAQKLRQAHILFKESKRQFQTVYHIPLLNNQIHADFKLFSTDLMEKEEDNTKCFDLPVNCAHLQIFHTGKIEDYKFSNMQHTDNFSFNHRIDPSSKRAKHS